MTDKKRLRVADYIDHIIDPIIRIEDYVEGVDQNAFVEDKLRHDAVIRNVEIIGEAANSIMAADREFAGKYPDLALAEAYRMRNALSHGYYTVNLLTVWNTVRNDLPVLKQQMIAIRTSMPPRGDRLTVIGGD